MYRPRILSNDTWIREYLSLLGSFCSLAVIGVLLAHFDRKPIFDTKIVTLNAILSVFSTMSKGWLLLAVAEAVSQWKWIAFARSRRRLIDFETINQASRGPYGSLRLLFTRNGMSLASLGAMITVLAIAVDPFMQQLLQLETRLTVHGHNATISRAQRFSQGTEQTVEDTSLYVDGRSYEAVQATADFAIQANILFGLVKAQQDIAQQIEFQCPSGSCTYNIFNSLAVCSICNDVTHLLKTQVTVMDSPLADYLARNNPGSFFGNVTNVTLPNGLFTNALDGQLFGDDFQVPLTTQSTGVPGKTLTLKDYDTLLMATSLIRVTNDRSNQSTTWPHLPISASECGLYYCVQSLNSTVVNGTINTVATELKNLTRARDSWLPLDRNITNATTDLQFRDPQSTIPRSDLMLGDGYNVSQSAVDGISSFLQDTLTMQESFPGITGAMVCAGSNDYQPASMQAFNDAASWPNLFSSVAAAMTNAMRNNADPTEPATGTNAVPITYYKVQWAWLALPASLLLAGFIFLRVAQIETKRAGIPVWKSNELAVLSRGQQAKEILAGAYLANEMEEKSKRGYTHLFERDMVLDRGSQLELKGMEPDTPTTRPSLRSHHRQFSEISAASIDDYDISQEPLNYSTLDHV